MGRVKGLLSGIDGPYTSSCPYVKDILRVRVDWSEVELIFQYKEVDMVYDIKSISFSPYEYSIVSHRTSGGLTFLAQPV